MERVLMALTKNCLTELSMYPIISQN
jgi:hypothetical protein